MNPKKHRPSRVALPGLALALGLALASSPSARAINAIMNDAFVSDTAPWSLRFGSTGAATLASSEGWGKIVIGNGGTSRSHVNLEHALSQPLVNGASYTISFDAYVSAAASMSIDVLLRGSTTIYGGKYSQGITTTPQRITLPAYTHNVATASNVDLSFRIGANTGTLHIDNVVVTRTGQASSLITKTGSIPTPATPWIFPPVQVPINGTSPVQTKEFSLQKFDFSYSGYNYGERETFVDIPANIYPVAVPALDADGERDITQNLINAVAAASTTGGTVQLPAGTFYIGKGRTGDAVTVSGDNTVIKGAGMGLTVLTVHPTYHSHADAEERQDASFNKAVINFVRPLGNNDSGDWIDGSAPSNAAFVTVPITLGDRTITVSDPSNTLVEGATINIRQIMWPAFVQAHAYIAGASKPYKWTTYDNNNQPEFNVPKYGLSYIRKIEKRTGNVLELDIPIPHDLDPANVANPVFSTKAITVVPRAVSNFVRNSGMQDLSFAAAAEQGVTDQQNAIGTTVMATGVMNGLFKNISVLGFRSIGLGTGFSVNTSFINCSVENAANCGGGGAGYAFYIRGQNLLYKNCLAKNVRHGFTTAAPQTSSIVIKNCTALDYRFNTDITTGEAVDDTHTRYSHGILWDNHYSKSAGLLMIPRGNLSDLAYQTCGWGIVWNYENEGENPLSSTGNDLRRNMVGITPGVFGIVVGAHSRHGLGLISTPKNNSSPGIRVVDGYTRYRGTSGQQDTDWGSAITTAAPQVGGKTPVGGSMSRNVMYEHTGSPVAESVYDIQFAQRAKMLPLLP